MSSMIPIRSSLRICAAIFLLFTVQFLYGQGPVLGPLDSMNFEDSRIGFRRSNYPIALVEPYADILIGFSTVTDYGYSTIGPNVDLRGGVYVGPHMLFGTSVSIVTLDNFEAAVNLPFEVGYSSEDKKIQVTSSIGYSCILFGNSSDFPEELSGRSITLDTYWRPTLNVKRMRIVVAAGAMMYDFGDSGKLNGGCSSCVQKFGPRYTFRLRAGIGF